MSQGFKRSSKSRSNLAGQIRAQKQTPTKIRCVITLRKESSIISIDDNITQIASLGQSLVHGKKSVW